MLLSNKRVEVVKILNRWCNDKDILICEVDERYLALEAVYAVEFGPYVGPYFIKDHEFHLVALPEPYSFTRVILRHSRNCPCNSYNYLMGARA